MLPGTRSEEQVHTRTHTHTHTHTHRVFSETHTYNKLSLYSRLRIVFTRANDFPHQHLNLSVSAGLSVSLCVTWQGANLGSYLSLQLCSRSLLCKHLIYHHCQSEQIRPPAAESTDPPPPLITENQPPCMCITNTQTIDPRACSI